MQITSPDPAIETRRLRMELIPVDTDSIPVTGYFGCAYKKSLKMITNAQSTPCVFDLKEAPTKPLFIRFGIAPLRREKTSKAWLILTVEDGKGNVIDRQRQELFIYAETKRKRIQSASSDYICGDKMKISGKRLQEVSHPTKLLKRRR